MSARPTSTDAILAWAAKQPRWQQSALALILSGHTLTGEDYDRLARACLAENGLASADPADDLPALRAAALPDADALAAARPLLRAISNVRGVNALAPGQRLDFGDALTLVYGANGAGKTGYVRIVASGAVARGERDVLGDVSDGARRTPPAATLEFDIDGAPVAFDLILGQPCAPLRRFYALDASGVQADLAGETELGFTPAALQPLAVLAQAIGEVKNRIAAMAAARTTPPDYAHIFEGRSPIADALATFGPNTDLVTLEEQAAAFSESALAETETALARLTLGASTEHAERLEADAAALEALAHSVRALKDALPDSLPSRIAELADDLAGRTAAFEALSATALSLAGDPALGRAFLEAARALAAPDYPHEGDACLLCAQSLTPAAAQRIQGFWAILGGTARTAVDTAHAALEAARTPLRALNPTLLPTGSLARTILQAENPALLRLVESLQSNWAQRLEYALGLAPPPTETPMLDFNARQCAMQLDNLINRRRTAAQEARAALAGDASAERAALEARRTLLQHQRQVAALLPRLRQEQAALRWAERALRIPITTAALTQLQTKLFAALVTDRYVTLFAQILARLGRPLGVTVETRGRRGATVKRLRLTETGSAVKITRVLSEGEARAVALADFLTEVTLDDASAGIVLDDPATSLDGEWQARVALLLAEEATRRQVIIFTHDEAFLERLNDSAASLGVPVTRRTLARGPADDLPGYVLPTP